MHVTVPWYVPSSPRRYAIRYADRGEKKEAVWPDFLEESLLEGSWIILFLLTGSLIVALISSRAVSTNVLKGPEASAPFPQAQCVHLQVHQAADG